MNEDTRNVIAERFHRATCDVVNGGPCAWASTRGPYPENDKTDDGTCVDVATKRFHPTGLEELVGTWGAEQERVASRHLATIDSRLVQVEGAMAEVVATLRVDTEVDPDLLADHLEAALDPEASS